MIVTAQTSKLKGVANVIMLFNHGDLCLLYSFFKGRRSHQKNSKQDHTGTLTPILQQPSGEATCMSNFQKWTYRYNHIHVNVYTHMLIYHGDLKTNLLSRNPSFLLFDRACQINIHFPYFYFFPENIEEVGADSMFVTIVRYWYFYKKKWSVLSSMLYF